MIHVIQEINARMHSCLFQHLLYLAVPPFGLIGSGNFRAPCLPLGLLYMAMRVSLFCSWIQLSKSLLRSTFTVKISFSPENLPLCQRRRALARVGIVSDFKWRCINT